MVMEGRIDIRMVWGAWLLCDQEEGSSGHGRVDGLMPFV